MPVQGPLGWRNWNAFENGFEESERSEAAFYSDADLNLNISEGLGPYELLATHGDPRRGVGPRLAFRMEFGVRLDDLMGESHASGRAAIELLKSGGSAAEIEESGYHGGDIFDEFAALVSLALGIRCRSGGRTRLWTAGDPLGYPIEWDHRPPYLPPSDRHGPLLPRLAEPSMTQSSAAKLLQLYHASDAEDAITLVRAARLYQQAVWIADADPNQAWIMLVSAIETAAVRWVVADVSPLDRIRAGMPRLARRLAGLPEEVANPIAELLAPLVGAQQRYLALLKEFGPPPPPDRPPEAFQVEWERLLEHARTIYDYRSRALHAGTPFPDPMCQSPTFPNEKDYLEKPFGLATQVNESVWPEEATPMLLATFEYIARKTLQGWWASL